MYNIGICDDEKSTCAELESKIMKFCKKNGVPVDVEVWYSGEDLCKDLESSKEYDLIFLDIELIHLSGIEVGSFIRNSMENFKMFIVYISSRREYAMSLFKSQPLDFLVKPIKQDDVDETFKRCIKRWEKDKVFFSCQKNGSHYKIPYNQIIYFCSNDKKIQIVTLKEKIEFYGKIKAIIPELPSNFMLIHQSYVINYNYVNKFTYEAVDLINGEALSISIPYRKEVRHKILSYQKGQE